jgi:hypothetical protein
MKKILFLFAFVLMLAASAAPLLAQDGCVRSTENPTALPALAGSAGAFLSPAHSRFLRK